MADVDRMVFYDNALCGHGVILEVSVVPASSVLNLQPHIGKRYNERVANLLLCRSLSHPLRNEREDNESLHSQN